MQDMALSFPCQFSNLASNPCAFSQRSRIALAPTETCVSRVLPSCKGGGPGHEVAACETPAPAQGSRDGAR